jgi:hypothetical protein
MDVFGNGCASALGHVEVRCRGCDRTRGAVRIAVVKRTAAVIATFVLLAVGVAIVQSVRDGWADARRFDPAQFRAAAGRDDLEVLESAAYAAVREQALLGLPRGQVRMSLGEPDRVGRRSRTYIWDLGMINDTLGPGDEGAFRVRFDRTWHVIGVEVS